MHAFFDRISSCVLLRGKDKQKNIFLRNVSKPKSEKRCVMIIMEESTYICFAFRFLSGCVCEILEGVLRI